MHGADALIWSDSHQTKGKFRILDYIMVHCQFMGWSMVREFGVHCCLYSTGVSHLSHITHACGHMDHKHALSSANPAVGQGSCIGLIKR